MNYFSLIQRYIPVNSPVYPIYITHCHMVTRKALAIARRIGLPTDRQRFVEEAAMLHDLGIVATNTPALHCYGSLPYLCHGVEGRAILEAEGYHRHGLIAERHVGAGLRKEDITEQNLPLPQRDMIPQTLEEELVLYADLFYSKNTERLWHARSIEEVQANAARYGEEKSAVVDRWIQQFERANSSLHR